MSGRIRLAVTALVLVASGCTSLPTQGPVRQAAEPSLLPDPIAVRRLAPPPQAGATPQEIVRGFLLASASVADGYAAARRYLVRSQRPRWSPAGGVVVLDGYDLAPAADPPAAARPGASTTVALAGQQVAAIDDLAAYELVLPPRPATATFALRVEDGQWRIAEAPERLHLLRYDVERVYRSLNVYYPVRGADRLVPDPVVLPAGDRLATDLVARLLAGPRPALAGAVSDTFPGWRRPEGFTVPVRGGVAEVTLTDVRIPPGFAREAFSAQVVWTLRQVPEVSGVRLSINGSPIDIPGVPSPQPVTAWAGFDPSVLQPAAARAYAVQAGRVGRLEGGTFVPLPGSAGSGRFDLVGPALSPDATTVVAISGDRTRLFRGTVAPQEPLRVQMRASALADASIDVSGTTWVLAGSGGARSVWAVPPDRSPVRVSTPAGLGPIREMRVSRNGLRIGLVTSREGGGDQLSVAVLRGSLEAGDLRLDDVRPLAPQLRYLRDVSWQGPARLAVLGAEAGTAVQPYLLSLDGFAVEALSPLLAGNAVSLSAAPGGAPLLAGTDGRRIFQASGRTWRDRARGVDPTYPG